MTLLKWKTKPSRPFDEKYPENAGKPLAVKQIKQIGRQLLEVCITAASLLLLLLLITNLKLNQNQGFTIFSSHSLSLSTTSFW